MNEIGSEDLGPLGNPGRARPVWVLAEQDEKGLREATLEVLGEGRKLADQLKDRLCCVLLGEQVSPLVPELGRHRVDTVYLAEDPILAQYTTDGYAAVLTDLVQRHDPFLILMAATPNGQDLAPRLATRLGVGFVPGCVLVSLDADGVLEFVKPTHQGKVYTTITCQSKGPHIATIRPGVIGPVPPGPFHGPRVIRYEPHIHQGMLRTRVLRVVKGDPKLIDLEEADLVVAGGRGVESAEHWHLIEDLAEALGAAVGGTRMAMDMGRIPRDRMIGQTGKSVRPKLYVAAGVSGVSHHLGGVDAEQMIAVNTDSNAQIMKCCELGIVGDLREILPLLSRRLEQMKTRTRTP
jgi:electron transfer flavoprotein alpha subunit